MNKKSPGVQRAKLFLFKYEENIKLINTTKVLHSFQGFYVCYWLVPCEYVFFNIMQFDSCVQSEHTFYTEPKPTYKTYTSIVQRCEIRAK